MNGMFRSAKRPASRTVWSIHVYDEVVKSYMIEKQLYTAICTNNGAGSIEFAITEGLGWAERSNTSIRLRVMLK